MTPTDVAAWFGAAVSAALLGARVTREVADRRNRKRWASNTNVNALGQTVGQQWALTQGQQAQAHWAKEGKP